MNAKQQLEMQADCIEAVLSAHKVAARVTGGTVTPRYARFTVLPAVGAKVSAIKSLDEEIARALAVETVRVSRRGAAVAVEVARSDSQPVRLLPLLRQLERDGHNAPAMTATLGLADDGAPLLIRLPSPDVGHILVAGEVGAGKSTLLRSIVLSLAMANDARSLGLVLIGSGLAVFDGLPHVKRVILDAGEAVEVLAGLVRLMEHKKDAGHIVVVIDDLDDVLKAGGGKSIARLTQCGREVGIHVIAATSTPALLSDLPGAVWPVRIAGRVACAEDAHKASGAMATGAERLVGSGDFLAVAEGRTFRFQAACASEEEIAQTLAAMGAPARSLPSVIY